MIWESNSRGAAVATVGFGVKDSRGREVGAVIMVEEKSSDVRVTVRSARNGEMFGAWPGSVQAESVDAGKALGVQRAEAVRRRVIKAASKTGGVYLTAGEARRVSTQLPRVPCDNASMEEHMHKVGDTVWVFDQNRRVYRQENGRSVGSPIFREHFRETTITGETSRSWIIRGGKVPKDGGDVRRSTAGAHGRTTVYMTREAVDAAVFRNDHQYKIAKMVEACSDIALMRQVAALMGYKAEE